MSRSRSKTSSVPLMLNRIANVATNTAVTIPAHDSSTESQSAPPSALSVHVFHRIAESNDPSSHPPPRTSSIEEPVATTPITNTTSPITITAGITSGRLITRTAISRITPNARAGSQRCSAEVSNRSLRGVKNGDTLEAT